MRAVYGVLFAASCLAAPTPLGAQPSLAVQNTQILVHGGVVDISYDLIVPVAQTFAVALEISQDGGRTYDVRPRTVSGDIGPGISSGVGKKIVWEAATDTDALEFNAYRFRVKATPERTGPTAPEGSVQPIPSAGRGVVVVTTTPAGAAVVVDGQPRGSTPLTLDDLSGGHRIVLSKDGYEDSTIKVYVTSRTNEKINKTLKQAVSNTQPAAGGIVSVTTIPAGVAVFVDGHPRGSTPLTLKDLPHGTHRIVLSMEGYADKKITVYVTKRTNQKINEALKPSAEWEYAARAGSDTAYWWGVDVDASRVAKLGTAPNQAASRSPWGTVAMAGGVWQWTSTLYRRYPYRLDDGREQREADGPRVKRGGAWNSGAVFLRAANRSSERPGLTSDALGFRCEFLLSGGWGV
jgi:hypothetical protein